MFSKSPKKLSGSLQVGSKDPGPKQTNSPGEARDKTKCQENSGEVSESKVEKLADFYQRH